MISRRRPRFRSSPARGLPAIDSDVDGFAGRLMVTLQDFGVKRGAAKRHTLIAATVVPFGSLPDFARLQMTYGRYKQKHHQAPPLK